MNNDSIKLTDSFGNVVGPELSVFPIVTFDPEEKHWTCLGTGFFIDSMGGFVTAKHVFFENGYDGKHVPTMYAIQSLPTGERIVRSITQIGVHKNADIAYGYLNYAKNHFVWSYLTPVAPAFILSLKDLNVGDKIKTFAFPLTTDKYTGDLEQTFTFKGRWEFGEIVEHHPNGMGLIKSECYQTSMKIDSGASGGPVMQGNHIIGVNSTGIEMPAGEEPISGITPIHFINEIQIRNASGTLIRVEDLIKGGRITIENH